MIDKRYYFTFGSDSRFPYNRNEFVVVHAPTAKVACEKFRARHPNRPGSPFLNCADVYTEDVFNGFRIQYYNGVRASETIF